jgi:hypothetical protein
MSTNYSCGEDRIKIDGRLEESCWVEELPWGCAYNVLFCAMIDLEGALP